MKVQGSGVRIKIASHIDYNIKSRPIIERQIEGLWRAIQAAQIQREFVLDFTNSRFLHRHTEHITVVSLSHEFHLIRPIPKQHVIVQCNNVAILFMQNDYNTGDQNFNLFTFDSSNNAFGSISGIGIGTIRSKWISMLKNNIMSQLSRMAGTDYHWAI